MSDQPTVTPLSQLGEFGLIQQITKPFTHRHASTLRGVGDDAAVIRVGSHCMLISTDLLVEGIHFDAVYTPLKHLGYKAVVVNLSDIYAMNATPTHITVSIALSSRYTIEAISELYEGIRHACDVYGVDMIGGDTTTAPSGLTISITAVGNAREQDIVYRNGAKAGDLICVTGDLGGAYLGLQILEREKLVWLDNPDIDPDLGTSEYMVHRQLKPEARRDVIAYLAEHGLRPTAMMDLSDGLSSDILHICQQSGVGCEIEEARIPIVDEVREQAYTFNLDPTLCAMNGGEDYELLFTIEPEDETKVADNPHLTIIGQITPADQGTMLLTKGGNRHTIKAQGWRHF